MESDGVSIWLHKQLKPYSKNLEKVPPESFAWISLLLSGSAGTLLYFTGTQQEWALAALLAALALLLLVLRLVSDSFVEMLCENSEGESQSPHQPNLLLIRLCSRLADISMLLGFAFWDSLRIHLVLCGIISMLLVSYVGEVARSMGADDSGGGLLCKNNRIILLVFFCVVYLLKPNARIVDFTVFEVMFAMFIPMASITLLQRMDSAIRQIRRK